jgi:hypothetical protein
MSPVFISTLQTAEGQSPTHRSSSRSAPDAIKSRLFAPLLPGKDTVAFI